MGFQISFTDNDKPVLIAQVIPLRIIGIVTGSDRVKVLFMFNSSIICSLTQFFRSAKMLMPVDALNIIRLLFNLMTLFSMISF